MAARSQFGAQACCIEARQEHNWAALTTACTTWLLQDKQRWSERKRQFCACMCAVVRAGGG
jgi:hypothetical protein